MSIQTTKTSRMTGLPHPNRSSSNRQSGYPADKRGTLRHHVAVRLRAHEGSDCINFDFGLPPTPL
jgi:hypothetical protein